MTRSRLVLLAATLLVALGALGACGDDSSDTASDPAPPSVTSPAPASPTTVSTTVPTPEPSQDPTPATGVTIVSQTAAGGEVSTTAVPLGDDAAVQEFTSQFTGTGLADEVSRGVARTDVPAGQALYGAVVSQGCDVPADVVVTTSGGEVTVTAVPVKSPVLECFAPVTSVALVLVSGTA